MNVGSYRLRCTKRQVAHHRCPETWVFRLDGVHPMQKVRYEIVAGSISQYRLIYLRVSLGDSHCSGLNGSACRIGHRADDKAPRLLGKGIAETIQSQDENNDSPPPRFVCRTSYPIFFPYARNGIEKGNHGSASLFIGAMGILF